MIEHPADEENRLNPSYRRSLNDVYFKAQIIGARTITGTMKTYGYRFVFFEVRQVNAWGTWQQIGCYHTGKSEHIKKMMKNIIVNGRWLMVKGTIINNNSRSESKYFVDCYSIEPIEKGLYNRSVPDQVSRPKPAQKMRRVDKQ